MFTSRSGWCTGSGRRSISSNSEKIAVLEPMTSASESAATTVTKGVLKSVRRASFRFRVVDARRSRLETYETQHVRRKGCWYGGKVEASATYRHPQLAPGCNGPNGLVAAQVSAG